MLRDKRVRSHASGRANRQSQTPSDESTPKYENVQGCKTRNWVHKCKLNHDACYRLRLPILHTSLIAFGQKRLAKGTLAQELALGVIADHHTAPRGGATLRRHRCWVYLQEPSQMCLQVAFLCIVTIFLIVLRLAGTASDVSDGFNF